MPDTLEEMMSLDTEVEEELSPLEKKMALDAEANTPGVGIQKRMSALPDNPVMRNFYVGFASAGTDALSLIGRLAGDNEAADWLNKRSQDIEQAAARQDAESMLPEWFNGAFRGATRSLATTGMAAPGGAAGVIGLHTAMRGNAAISEADSSGLEGSDKWEYVTRAAAIEGVTTAIFHKIGLGGAESLKATKEILGAGFKQGLKQLGGEVTEELTIEILDSVNQVLTKNTKGESVNPNAFDNPVERVGSIVAQTVLTMGMLRIPNQVAGQYYQDNPDQAQVLGAIEEPTEEQWAEAGLPPVDAKTRAAFTESLRQIDGDQVNEDQADEQKAVSAGPKVGAKVSKAKIGDSQTAQDFARNEPEKAEELKKLESPSRSQFKRLTGIRDSSMAERKAFVEGLKSSQVESESDQKVTLGLSREPVVDTTLQNLSEEEFDERQREVNKLVDELEAKLDDGSITKTEEIELAKRQDVYEAYENERYRRNMLDASAEEIARRFRNLNLKHKGDKVRALILTDILKSRSLESEVISALEEITKLSPNHAEVITGQVGDLKRLSKEVYGDPNIRRSRELEKRQGKRPTKGELSKELGLTKIEASRVLRSLPRSSRASEQLNEIESNRIQPRVEELKAKDFKEIKALAADLGVKSKGSKSRLIRDVARAEVGSKLEAIEAQAIKEAEDSKIAEGLGSLGGQAFMRRTPVRDDTVPGTARSNLPEEIQERLNSSFGLRKPKFIEKIKAVGKFVKQVARPQKFLKNTAENAVANDEIRRMAEIGDAASETARRKVLAMVDPLGGPAQLQAMADVVISRNLSAAVNKRGESLRLGFTPEMVKQYASDARRVAESIPAVKKAVENRDKWIKSYVEKLVENDILPKDALKNTTNYYHQQVLDKVQANRMVNSSSLKADAGFQKGRTKGKNLNDEKFDFNTDYLQAEVSWITDAEVQLRRQAALKRIRKQYDKIDKVQKLTAERVASTGENKQEAFYDIVQEQFPGHKVISILPGNVFFKSFTQAEIIQEEIDRGILDKTDLDVETKMKLLSTTGNTLMVLPEDIADQITDMQKPKEPNPVASAFFKTQGWWKAYVLTAPQNIIGYTLRNLTGDFDVLLNVPGSLKFIRQAEAELRKDLKGSIGVSENFKKAKQLGVISASQVTQETEDLALEDSFQRFYDQNDPKKAKPNLFRKYAGAAKRFNDYREGIFRYAAFLYYQNQLKTKGIGRENLNYGASKKEVIDALYKTLGVDEAAAKLSRDLLGDYGNLSVAGNFLRKTLIPFYSWLEVNTSRYPRLIMNALASPGKGRGRAVAGATLMAAKAVAVSRLGMATALFYLWNNMMFPDEEEALADYEKQTPHLILGRNSDGTVIILRNTGAASDFLSWLNINETIQLFEEMQEGRADASDIFTGMSKAPVQKIAGGISPFVKLPVEVLTGQSWFPDVFNPRKVDRLEHAVSLVGGQNIVRAVRGRIMSSGERARGHMFERLIGVSDPKRNALFKMYQLRTQFLESKGRSVPDFGGVKSPWRNIRQAAEDEDFEAFREAKSSLIKDGKTYDDFLNMLVRLDPLHGKLPKGTDEEFINEFLNPKERVLLNVARQHQADLRRTLMRFWSTDAALGGDSGTQKKSERLEAVGRKLISAISHATTDNKKQMAIDLAEGMDEDQVYESLVTYWKARSKDDRRPVRVKNGKLTSFGKKVNEVSLLLGLDL